MNRISIEPYNREQGAPNAYQLRVEGDCGIITSWHATLFEALTVAEEAAPKTNDWHEWERYA